MLFGSVWIFPLFIIYFARVDLFVLRVLHSYACTLHAPALALNAAASRSINNTATDQLISNLSQQNLLQAKNEKNKYYGDVNCRTKCHHELRLLHFLFSPCHVAQEVQTCDFHSLFLLRRFDSFHFVIQPSEVDWRCMFHHPFIRFITRQN